MRRLSKKIRAMTALTLSIIIAAIVKPVILLFPLIIAFIIFMIKTIIPMIEYYNSSYYKVTNLPIEK